MVETALNYTIGFTDLEL